MIGGTDVRWHAIVASRDLFSLSMTKIIANQTQLVSTIQAGAIALPICSVSVAVVLHLVVD